MTNDPERNPEAGGTAGSGEPWTDPPRPESIWSRPTDAGSPPSEPYGQPPPPWPPAAAAQSTPGEPGPAGYPAGGYPGAPTYPPSSAYPPPPPYPGQPAAGPPVGAPPPGQRTNALAIIALICSLAGLITAISAPIGAVLGHIALRQIGQTGEEGGSLAKAAIWVGWIITGLIVAACCALLVVALVANQTSTDFAPR